MIQVGSCVRRGPVDDDPFIAEKTLTMVSQEGSTFVAPKFADASMHRTAAVSTERQASNPVSSSTFQVCAQVVRAFDSILIRPIKTRLRLDRDIAELRCLDERDLRDIGINRTDIAAIRAGTYKGASSDQAERTDAPVVRWYEAPRKS